MLLSIIVLIWTGLFAAVNEHVLNYGVKDQAPFLSRVGEKGWYQAIALGLAVGLANYLAPKGGWAILSLVLVVAALVYIAWWFFQSVSEWKEWGLFCLMSIPATFVLAAACAGVAEMIKSTFWVSVFMTLPAILRTAFGGFLLTRLMFVKYKITEKLFYKIARWFAWGLTVVILVVQIIGINWGAINWNWGKKTTEPEPTTPTVVEEPVKTPVWRFSHYETLKNADALDDFDFGVFNEKIGEMSADDVAELHYEVGLKDPANGVPAMVNTDIRIHTDFTWKGIYLDGTKPDGEMTTWINSKIAYYVEHPEEYVEAFERWHDFMMKYAIPRVAKGKGIKDQMYQVTLNSPVDETVVPEVVVLETDHEEGDILFYDVTIKGNVFSIPFRINCLFQPTDVAKLLDVTPGKNPNNPIPTPNPGKPSGGNPDPGKPSGGDPDPGKPSGGDPGKPGGGDPPSDDPGGDDPYDPPYNKDPNQGTPVGGNDNPGPGPSTNNGVGAMYSSEENPNNSAFDTYEEYQQEMQELAEANANQAVGGDPNTPSYTPPGTNNGGGTTTVDSNADSGTGNGGIDAGTPTHNTNVDSDVGGSTSTSDDPVGTEWGGPPD